MFSIPCFAMCKLRLFVYKEKGSGGDAEGIVLDVAGERARQQLDDGVGRDGNEWRLFGVARQEVRVQAASTHTARAQHKNTRVEQAEISWRGKREKRRERGGVIKYICL